MRGIRIINPGIYTTIQDSGRFGYRESGLPTSGAMDMLSFVYANWLVRNNHYEGAIETMFHGLELEFLSPTSFAVTGGEIVAEKGDRKIESWKSYKAKKGDTLIIKRLLSGARIYLAIAGGFRINSELNSLSTYLPAELGGFRGRMLKKDDIIPLYPSVNLLPGRKMAIQYIPHFKQETKLRITRGVDHKLFPDDIFDALCSNKYIVSQYYDRMGIRLDGDPLPEISEANILSYGIHPGAIQIPKDGLPIIMGPDCQTTGGYPQLANIISADIYKTGQIKTGDTIRFELVTLEEADNLLREHDKMISGIIKTGASPVCTDCIEKRR